MIVIIIIQMQAVSFKEHVAPIIGAIESQKSPISIILSKFECDLPETPIFNLVVRSLFS